VVNAIAHIHIKPPRLTKQCFVAGGAAAVTVAGGLLLGIRLRFHNHTPQQLATFLALHQQAADELGCNLLGGASEERGRQMSWGSGHLFKVCASNHMPAVDGAGAIQWVHSPGVRGRCISTLDFYKLLKGVDSID